MITEDQLEQLCLDWFNDGRYVYVPELVLEVAVC